MKKILLSIIILILLSPFSFADDNQLNIPSDEFYKANVVKILEEKEVDGYDGEKDLYQKVAIEITSGEEDGKKLLIEHGKGFHIQDSQIVKEGETVSIVKSYGIESEPHYYIGEKYRLNSVFYIFLFFLAAVYLVARKKGLFAVLGLFFSVLILIKWVIPQIAAGHNALLISFIGAIVIAFVSIYLSHGFRKRTTIALISTIFTVFIALVLATIFVSMTNLFGIGSEDAFVLQIANIPNLNLKGLLLGGIIIGALGILDDVTTAQAAVVEEIHKANLSLSFKELYKRAYSVGEEHIASMINTLALAYIGASFPMFLLFHLNKTQPLWVILNSESMVEEIVRTLVGSSALLLAVPISTFLAAYYFGNKVK